MKKLKESEVFSNSIPRDVELLFGDSEGSNAWYLFMYLHARGFFGWKFLLVPSKEMLHEVLYIQYIHNARKLNALSSIDIG